MVTHPVSRSLSLSGSNPDLGQDGWVGWRIRLSSGIGDSDPNVWNRSQGVSLALSLLGVMEVEMLGQPFFNRQCSMWKELLGVCPSYLP